MKKLTFFRGIVCNCLIVICVVTAFAFTFNSQVVATFGGEKLSPIYLGNTKSGKVCLMINVYWGTEYLDSMLETLKKHNVKTTFFIGGSWANQNCEKLKQIFDDGHEIANHGYYHKDHDKISLETNKQEIYMCHEVVKKLIGVEMNLFAPPSGAYNNNTIIAAQSLGYKTIMWSRDTIDWRDKDANIIYSRATKEISGGELVLMHPTQKTAESLDSIISTIQSKGLQIAPVSEVI